MRHWEHSVSQWILGIFIIVWQVPETWQLGARHILVCVITFSGTQPPLDWPTHGEIRLEQVSVRYDESLPAVLKDITVYVRPGEKVGFFFWISWNEALVC